MYIRTDYRLDYLNLTIQLVLYIFFIKVTTHFWVSLGILFDKALVQSTYTKITNKIGSSIG